MSFFRRERGQVLVLFAFGLPVLLGGLGLSVDIGAMMVTRTTAQKTADAAVIAGGDFLITVLQGTSVSTGLSVNVEQEAKLYALKNGYVSSDVKVACVAGQCSTQMTSSKCPTADPNHDDCVAKPQNYIRVDITTTKPTYFMRVLGKNTTTTRVHAIIKINDVPKNYALLVLNPHACPAYSSSSNLTIINGGAMVDSDCPTGAVSENGGSIVTAVDGDGSGPACANSACPLDHYSKGTVVLSNNSQAIPSWTGVSAPAPDPLACSPPTGGWNPPPGNTGTCLPPPMPCQSGPGASSAIVDPANLPSGCVPKSATSKNSSRATNPAKSGKADANQVAGVYRFKPGSYYGGLAVDCTSCEYFFEPGIYVFAGGGNTAGFSYSSNAKITGTNVTFFNTDDPVAGGSASNKACGPMTLTGNGQLNFTAPASGPSSTNVLDGYKAMLFWQSPRCAVSSDGTYTPSNPPFNFSGGSSGSSWDGVIYLPKAELSVQGGGNLGSIQVIVDKFTLGGGNNITITYKDFWNTGTRYVKLVE